MVVAMNLYALAEDLEKNLLQWLPQRDHTFEDHAVWRSANDKVWLSVGGDIYKVNLILGHLLVSWDEHPWDGS